MKDRYPPFLSSVLPPFLFFDRQFGRRFYEISPIKQAADLLQITPLTVRRKIKTDEIAAIHLGRKVLFPDEFFEKLKEKAINS